MPFDSWMDITTVRSYTQIWRQLLCYVFRAEGEEPEDRPAYKLTERQKISMCGLQAIVEEFQGWKNEQPSIVSGVESKGAVTGQGEEGGLEEGMGFTRQSGGNSEGAVTDQGEEGESDKEIAFMRRIQREWVGGIISGLAVLGIRDNDGWLNAEDYTSKYSAVAKLAQMMVVHEGYEQRQEEIKRKTEANERQGNGLTADQIGEAAQSYFHHIRRLTYQFMTMAYDGRDPTPIQWIYKARSYRFKIRYTTTAEGCIQWVGDSILYQQIRFNIGQVRSMVQGLVQEAREELFGKLMMMDSSDGFASVPTDAPPIDWDHMVDNPSESRVGWSFLDDERNRFAVDGQWWLYERMYHERRLREQFTDQGEGSSPQISA
ncbi:hypothetical protein V496_02277 [Pseudogymnoascus sp. VKM F-4515 (FW-2607)]|nr:hypothetical protein V496_02277 [Pseudogymnoascus sp. VKM F-4515 (FW-2607)]